MPEDSKPYLDKGWLDPDIPTLYDWYDDYPFDLGMWRTLCRDVKGPILDLACGTGRVAIELARAGHRVVGLDVSPAMIARAREKLQHEAEDVQQRVTYHVGDVVDFALDAQFPMAIMPCMSFHEIGTLEARESCLRSVWRHLDHGGRLIVALSVWKPGATTAPPEEPAEWGPPDMDEVNPHTGIATRLWILKWYDIENKTRCSRFYFEEHDGKGRSIRQFAMTPPPAWSRAWFLDHDEMRAMLEACGFSVEHVYGDYDLNPVTPKNHRMTFDARKT